MQCCKTIPMESIQLTRGDDSNALGHYIKLVMNTEIDLTGWYAIFQLENFQWRFNELKQKENFLSIPSEISLQLTPGAHYGAIKVYDTFGRCATIVKNIPFFVNEQVVDNPAQD